MAINPKSLKNLNPAKPGEVRNPDGIKGEKTVSAILKELLKKGSGNKDDTGRELTRAESIALKMFRLIERGETDQVQLKAIEQVLDRTEGKPTQEIKMPGSHVIQVNKPQ